MKNVSVIGGLLAVYAFGPGRLSIDRVRVARARCPVAARNSVA